jgi:hypothetical protein
MLNTTAYLRTCPVAATFLFGELLIAGRIIFHNRYLCAEAAATAASPQAVITWYNVSPTVSAGKYSLKGSLHFMIAFSIIGRMSLKISFK